MKHLIFLFLFIPLLTICQNNLTFKAQLIDYTPDKIPAYCGYFAFVTTLKFQLSENVDTLKKGQNIILLIMCPREKGMDLYENEHEYYVTTYGESEEDKKEVSLAWSIVENYINEKIPKIWCKKLEKE